MGHRVDCRSGLPPQDAVHRMFSDSSAMPAANSSVARKPSALHARVGSANTWRTSPSRNSPGHHRRRPAVRRARAAISPMLRGVPEQTLNAPGTGSGAVSARTLARATSRTWTKSRSCPPSSKTRGARPAAIALAKIAATPAYGRVARHPRAVDVVVAQRRHGHAGLARERRGQVLLVELGRRVDVARVGGRVLADRLGRERRPADRARRLEAAGRQVRGAARAAGGRGRARRSGSGPRRRRPCSRRARGGPRSRAGRARAAAPRCRGRCGRRSRRCRRCRCRARPSPPGG